MTDFRKTPISSWVRAAQVGAVAHVLSVIALAAMHSRKEKLMEQITVTTYEPNTHYKKNGLINYVATAGARKAQLEHANKQLTRLAARANEAQQAARAAIEELRAKQRELDTAQRELALMRDARDAARGLLAASRQREAALHVQLSDLRGRARATTRKLGQMISGLVAGDLDDDSGGFDDSDES